MRITKALPLCDDTDRPSLKAVIHGVHLLILVLEALYHGKSAIKHLMDCKR